MLHKKRITFTVIRFFVVTWKSELLPPNPRASAVEGEKLCRPPVAEISTELFSPETSDLPGGQSRRLRARTGVRICFN